MSEEFSSCGFSAKEIYFKNPFFLVLLYVAQMALKFLAPAVILLQSP
jgi:hypothetical protein